MKKLSFLLSIFGLLITFNCDNEPVDQVVLNVPQVTCADAITNTSIVAMAFADATVVDFENLCSQLKTALQAQIDACGDSDGSLQLTIFALGDCSENNQDDCATSSQAVLLAQLALNNSTTDTYSNLCNAYKSALENQILVCGDDDGSIQTTIDDLGDCIL